MDEAITLIRAFNDKFRTTDPGHPTVQIDPKYRDLRIKLMEEELKELVEGMRSEDMENIAKECADLLYVLLGTVSAYGLLDVFFEVFQEVHDSNMSKTYVEGQGKPAKLNDYCEADVRGVLAK